MLPHRESTFLYTEPPSVIGAWLAIEEATTENGCLYVLPKSHEATLHMRYGWNADGKLDVLWGEHPEWDMSVFRALPTKPGTLVLLHGSVVHCSGANTSDISRHAYTVHYVESTSGYEWSKENWLQRPVGFDFEPLYTLET